MTNTTLDKTTIGFGLSAAIVSILNTLLVIFKETDAAFQERRWRMPWDITGRPTG